MIYSEKKYNETFSVGSAARITNNSQNIDKVKWNMDSMANRVMRPPARLML